MEDPEEDSDELAAARKAKGRAKEIFSPFGIVNGIGLTRWNGHYAVKVNFETAPESGELPREIDGIPVVVQVVGKVRKQPS